MAYGVMKVNIDRKRYPALYAYLDKNSRRSKLLRNATLFRLRNNFTSRGKKNLSANEQEVQDEINLMYEAYPSAGKIKSVISYPAMEKILRATKNPDYFSGIPIQTAQWTVRQACGDFQNWLKALKDYKSHPKKYLGRPRMPGYVKAQKAQVIFTNQECRIRDGKLFFPKTDVFVPFCGLPEGSTLKEVKCSPDGDSYVLYLTHETPAGEPVLCDMPFTAAIDFGVNNLASIVTDADTPCLIYKGGAVKSMNQWFNKEQARLQSEFMKGKPANAKLAQTHALHALSQKRSRFLSDYFHKIAKHLVSWCMENSIGCLVLGSNKLWKQECNMGSVNNQNFVQIPFSTLKQMLHYLCDRAGIRCIEQEESYTSKASVADRDGIPVYDPENKNAKYTFSGDRVKRGLYRTKEGYLLNADLNGAANIGRKAFVGFLEGTDIPKKLSSIEVIRYGHFYKTPAKKNALGGRSARTKSKRLIPAIEAA